tara:strand:- start:135 stop:329 length:195 start_codon:yes stop_codon:yes gene_type:complete
MFVEKTKCFKVLGRKVSIKDDCVLIFCKKEDNPKAVGVSICKYLMGEGLTSESINYEIQVIKDK